MNQKETEHDKWTQTGWKIEQQYGNKVLLGNWAEERLQFTREPRIANSTSRVDYVPHWDFKPDFAERRSALLRAEGLPYRLLFAHHCTASSNYLTTEYGRSFGHKHNSSLPTLQSWHLNNFTRELERSDWQTSAIATDLGSLKNQHFEKLQSQLPSLTVYQSTYQRHPVSALCTNRFARTSRILSSHLYTNNNNHKDLNLRQNRSLQVPDNPFWMTKQAQKQN